MYLTKTKFRCLLSIRTVVLIGFTSATLLNAFVLSLAAQSSGSGDLDFNQLADGEESISQPIKDFPEEPSLEKEYDEKNIDWHDWAQKVAGAVWGPLINGGGLVCGRSRVKWQVTSDCRVHIISIQTPLAGGVDLLVNSIKALDGNPILAFPEGSHKTVVDRVAWTSGSPVFHRVYPPVAVYP